MATILLLGLERSLADELSRALVQLGHHVLRSRVAGTADADLVFAPPSLLRAVLNARPGLPVVVASRLPEVRDWLDALQAGAADYCGAPFDATQVAWVLNSTLGAVRRQAA